RADAPGRDHSRARARARSCPGPRARRRARARLPVGSWRQGSCGGARPLSMKTLVVYLMSGPKTPELAAAAVAGGADVIELGFPFSDPLADGPVIRRAAERALGQGMRTRACLDCVARSRELLPETPLVPIYVGFGISTPEQAQAAAELTDGIVVGSRPVEVAEEGAEALRRYVRTLRDAVDSVVAV